MGHFNILTNCIHHYVYNIAQLSWQNSFCQNKHYYYKVFLAFQILIQNIFKKRKTFVYTKF